MPFISDTLSNSDISGSHYSNPYVKKLLAVQRHLETPCHVLVAIEGLPTDLRFGLGGEELGDIGSGLDRFV